MKYLSYLLCLICISACTAADKNTAVVKKLNEQIITLKPLHKVLGKPQPGDWLLSHKEPGQTFKQYLSIKPITAHGKRNVIYIQPIGDFTEKQKEVVKLTAEYMQHFFNLKVIINKDVPLKIIPAKAKRVHPQWGDKQILSTYVLYDVLKPKLPKDAAVSLALTASDLWPGKGWNFVFGQASLRERVGVWSMYRNGDPEINDDQFRLFLKRTIKTAVHETGHMFSIKHCTAYECTMCGSNNRNESDRRPIYACPECLAKVCYATKADAKKRYENLKQFCDKHGFKEEAKFFQLSLDKLK